MQVVGNFNKISEEKKKSLRTLQPGQTVVYELLEFEIDHATGARLYGSATELPGRDRIRDGNELVEIGIPRMITGDNRVTKVDGFILGKAANALISGRFELSGDNLKDIEWDQFFQLCNYNESNPNADKSVKKKIKELNFAEENRKKRERRNVLAKALSEAVTMTSYNAEKVRMFAAAMGWDSSGNIDLLNEKTEAFAQDHPAKFLAIIGDPETKTKAELGVAKEKGIIAYDPTRHVVTDATGNTLGILDRMEGKTWIDMFHQYLKAKPDGVKILQGIQNSIAARIENEVSQQKKNDKNKGKGPNKPNADNDTADDAEKD